MSRHVDPELVAAIATDVLALMDAAPDWYRHGDHMAGDHAYNHATRHLDGRGGRADWFHLQPHVEAEIQARTGGACSIYRAPCGCLWEHTRLDDHGRRNAPWCNEAAA